MGDGSSIVRQIAENIQDLGKDTGIQTVKALGSMGKTAVSQIKTSPTDKQKEEKEKQKIETFQRVKQIEAEMAQIAQQNQQKQGPEIIKKETSSDDDNLGEKRPQKVDEALRQTLGRAEQGRNFKG